MSHGAQWLHYRLAQAILTFAVLARSHAGPECVHLRLIARREVEAKFATQLIQNLLRRPILSRSSMGRPCLSLFAHAAASVAALRRGIGSQSTRQGTDSSLDHAAYVRTVPFAQALKMGMRPSRVCSLRHLIQSRRPQEWVNLEKKEMAPASSIRHPPLLSSRAPTHTERNGHKAPVPIRIRLRPHELEWAYICFGMRARVRLDPTWHTCVQHGWARNSLRFCSFAIRDASRNRKGLHCT